ncbi:MAG: hypothetical protein JWR22_4276 [Herminiimonas sp.]|nr:hypothetical protein [Herminiimonas sp.]
MACSEMTSGALGIAKKHSAKMSRSPLLHRHAFVDYSDATRATAKEEDGHNDAVTPQDSRTYSLFIAMVAQPGA